MCREIRDGSSLWYQPHQSDAPISDDPLEGMCCNFQKTATERLIESTRLGVMQPPCGSNPKYRHKVEHKRVLRNQLGKQILETLIKEGILRKDGSFYHIESDQCDKILGISWHQLRQYKSSSRLEEFFEKGVVKKCRIGAFSQESAYPAAVANPRVGGFRSP